MSDKYVDINLFDEKGSLKNKDEFLEEMEKLYDSCTKKNNPMTSFDYLDYVSSADNQIDVLSTFNTFNFLGRYIYLNDEITHETAKAIHQFVNFWNNVEDIDGTPAEEVIPLTIFINSNGGDLDAALSITSIIRTSRIPVNTVVIGRAWSAAFLITLCGHNRAAYEHSTFLFHEGNTLFGENAHKFIQYSDFYKQEVLKFVEEITTSNSKITSNEYQLHKNDDWWMTANEALKYGVIDKIIGRKEAKKDEG